jgi:hypothetical protein
MKNPNDKTERGIYKEIARAAKRAGKAMEACSEASDHTECKAADAELDKFLKYYGYVPVSQIFTAIEGTMDSLKYQVQAKAQSTIEGRSPACSCDWSVCSCNDWESGL